DQNTPISTSSWWAYAMSLLSELARPDRSSVAMTRSRTRRGHDDLRDRLLTGSRGELREEELLELLLRSALHRHDVQPLAAELIGRFGSLPTVLSASPRELRRVKGIGDAVIVLLRLVDRLRSPQPIAPPVIPSPRTGSQPAQAGLPLFP